MAHPDLEECDKIIASTWLAQLNSKRVVLQTLEIKMLQSCFPKQNSQMR